MPITPSKLDRQDKTYWPLSFPGVGEFPIAALDSRDYGKRKFTWASLGLEFRQAIEYVYSVDP